jgi:hypothetical protein
MTDEKEEKAVWVPVEGCEGAAVAWHKGRPYYVFTTSLEKREALVLALKSQGLRIVDTFDEAERVDDAGKAVTKGWLALVDKL